jgi:hypothetical protein
MAVQGERIAGGYILMTGIDGIRYAIRPQSVAIIQRRGRVPRRELGAAIRRACRPGALCARQGTRLVRFRPSSCKLPKWRPYLLL